MVNIYIKKTIEKKLAVSNVRNQQEFKQTEIGRLPKEWEVKKVIELFDVETGTTPSTKQKEYWNEGNINWITPSDMSKLNGRLYIQDSGRKITEKGLKGSNLTLLPSRSIVVSSRAPVGYIAVTEREATFNQGCKGLIPKKGNKIYSEFYAYYFLNKKIELENLSGGSTFKELSKERLENFCVPFPPLSEQKKIAEILTTVDQGIEKVDEAIKKTQRLKNGLMQELLTKGIGHKEFKETEVGRIPKEWKSIKLEEISIGSPQNGLYKNKESYGNGFKIVRMTELFREDVLIINDMAIVNVSKEELARFSLHPGDLLFARRSLKIEGSGKCVLVPKIDEPILFESSIIRITLNKILAYPLFFLYYLNSVGRKQISRMTRTVAVSGITGRDLQNIFIPLPSLREQQKIAEILSTADERLELLRKRKGRLKRTKKGLMDVLLTGRKRVRLEV